jgi:hypothetical protein
MVADLNSPLLVPHSLNHNVGVALLAKYHFARNLVGYSTLRPAKVAALPNCANVRVLVPLQKGDN